MKLEILKPADFISQYYLPEDVQRYIAEIGNKKINDWLAYNSKVVQGSILTPLWGEVPKNPSHFAGMQSVIGGAAPTHKALLICIEPLEVCTHPKEKVKAIVVEFWQKEPAYSTAEIRGYQCDCGVKVVPNSFVEEK